MRANGLETTMTDKTTDGDRIAKVMARAGVASRRDAERMILEGRVAVNGIAVTSPALDVLSTDRVTLDGKAIDAPQAARLWLYYKPLGLVTSSKDEKGRQTVFDTLPQDMPRVMPIGRLDLNSEGLLLLTNDGGLKRRLELPSTGWLRKYRVRVNGRPNEATFDPLRRGVTIEGEDFLPMDISLDRQQGANAWLTVGLREGKNREIRRAMSEVGLTVNRLIRVSYGPFRLNTMKPGDVVEVKQKVLREQLGDTAAGAAAGGDAPPRARKPRSEAGNSKPRADKAAGMGTGTDRPRRPGGRKPEGGEGFAPKSRAERPRDGFAKDARPPAGARKEWPRKDGARDAGARSGAGAARGPGPDDRSGPRPERAGGGRKTFGPRDGAPDGGRPPRPQKTDGFKRRDRDQPGASDERDHKPRRAAAGPEAAARKPRPGGADAGQKPRPPQTGGRPDRAAGPNRKDAGAAPRGDKTGGRPDRPGTGKGPRGPAKGPRGPGRK